MRVITSTDELKATCERLARSAFVAVDTEFMRETTFWPKLCLVQLAGPEEELIVDPLAPGIDLRPFFALMNDAGVVKVFHAARQDIEIVWHQARIIPHPVFDTQVAAMVCGFGESVSYVNLVKKLLREDVDKTNRFTDWARRPLDRHQLAYALGDVTHLREIYQHLLRDLEASGRTQWLKEEMAELTDPKTYELHPEDAWRRLKQRVKTRRGLAVMMELAAWRERQAQAQDVPRNRVLRDEALYDISTHAPTDANALGRLRTLSDGYSRSARGKEIMEVVKRGLARDPKTVPALGDGSPLPPEAGALVDLLRVLLKAAAARHKVASKLIATSEDLERIAVEAAPDVHALKGWRRELFGSDALRLKRGEIAITVVDGEIVTLPIEARVRRPRGEAAEGAAAGDPATSSSDA